jgi:UDP-GlcNAc:undecaprenyl-phosphate/decaprenyl-phosphate GlcNAc-1-phosphate transferase
VIERLRVANHRGVQVPAILGLALGGFAAASVAAVALLDRIDRAGWIATAALALVLAAGLVDDLLPSGPRGIREHLRALAAGRVSTGIVELVVVAGAAAVTVAAVPGRTGLARVAGALLIAASANVCNGLDVRPGRAIKFFLPVALVVLATPWPAQPFLPGVALGALLLLPWDAGERAMLGDAGANLLGFTAGLGLFHLVHGWALLAAALLAVALNVLADTVTLTRLIEIVPPLRWYDAMGRRT